MMATSRRCNAETGMAHDDSNQIDVLCKLNVSHSGRSLMKLAVLVIAVAATQLAGCAATSPMIYNKAGVNEQDYKRDFFECRQASKTSWSGGGSGLIGIAMIAGSSAAAQDAANKTGRMCMEARGYTSHILQDGELAARVRAKTFCMSQLKAPALVLGDRAFFPPSTVATAAMLADNSKVTPEQKAAILDWSSARQKCFDREKQELQAINYPQQLAEIHAAAATSAGVNLVRLYRGEITWADFNRVRNEDSAEYAKSMSAVSILLAQATPDAVQQAKQLAAEQQKISVARLSTVTAPRPDQVGCVDRQLDGIAFSDCN